MISFFKIMITVFAPAKTEKVQKKPYFARRYDKLCSFSQHTEIPNPLIFLYFVEQGISNLFIMFRCFETIGKKSFTKVFESKKLLNNSNYYNYFKNYSNFLYHWTKKIRKNYNFYQDLLDIYKIVNQISIKNVSNS